MNTQDCFLVVFVIVGQLGTKLVIQKKFKKKKTLELQLARLEDKSKFERE